MGSSLAVIAIELQSPYEYLMTVLIECLLFIILHNYIAMPLVEYRIHSFKSLFTLAMYVVKMVAALNSVFVLHMSNSSF